MKYFVHFFEHLNDTLRSLYSVEIEAENVSEARSFAIVLLPTIVGALGFRICDGTDRQVDIYVPVDSIRPAG